MNRTDELRTARIESLVTPAELALRYPVTPGVATHVTDSRRRIEKILNGEDKRLLVIIGPCSIHDLTAAMEYATRLQSLRNQYQSRLEIVMRTYFEKPRTVVGWKGLISDPDLNGSYRVNHGLELARKLLLQVNELGVPTATEFLDMVTGQFIADLINRFELNAKIIKRRNKYVVYLKSSEKIGDFLRAIGASQSVMNFESTRIDRSMSNTVNRWNNCDIANEMKSMATANKQLEDIETVDMFLGLDMLDEKTRAVALIRKKYPELTLNELTEVYYEETGQTISKSGLHHRFKKISEEAKRLIQMESD